MNKPNAFRLLAASLAAALMLTACGGGGGGGDSEDTAGPPPSSRFGASESFEGICTVEGQKRFVRSYLDERYLWYNEIVEVDPARYSSPADYFNALLVKTPDASGQPRDRFSAVLPSASAENVLARAADVSTAQANHTPYVPVSRVFLTPSGRRVGYIQFNDHATGAQDDLITAFRTVRDGGLQDLVLDLRQNSGGFLYVALTAASMITGPQNNGKVFEQLQYNDKRQAETDANTLRFGDTVQFAETFYPQGSPIPQLNLPRVYILTSSQTCSSSESIINGLRGVDVQVVLIGDTTCGKPYGFHRKDNCGLAYFPLEFKGSNAKGFGDYTTGFRPTCTVTDNPRAARGSASDPLLVAAQFHIENGACPAGTQTAQSSAAPDASVPAQQPARPAWAGRLLRPQ
jgi:hypothetical protein